MYAFWLSFSLAGFPTVSPTIWPLVWLGFAFILLFDPFPLTFRSSRYWLLRIVARLFVSGTRRVEVRWLIFAVYPLIKLTTIYFQFTDFWMGYVHDNLVWYLMADFITRDQFCSLIFTLSNLFFFVCTYVDNFSDDFKAKCSSSSKRWPIAFALAALPLVIRLVQSVKRFADSGLVTHLINVCSKHQVAGVIIHTNIVV